MKTEIECENFARDKLTEYVNGCACDSKDDVLKVLQKMLAVSMHAINLVENGTMSRPP